MKQIIFFILVFFSHLLAAKCQIDSLRFDTAILYISLEEALIEPLCVYKLSLKRKKFTEFPKEIFKLSNLRELDLSRNKITELPKEIGELTKLQVLNISRNKLEIIPKEIGKLKQLKQLIIFSNEIPWIPPEIGDMTNLEFLDIWGNELEELPYEITNLKNLRVLDLRVIEFNKERQREIKEWLPHTKVHFSNSCNCGG